MNLIFFIILSLLAVVGGANIVLWIFYHFTKIKDDNAVLLIIPQINKNIDVEFAVRSVIAKLKKLGNCSINNIICLSDDLDEITLKKLYLLEKDYQCLYIMTKEDFKEKAGL